MSLTRILLFLTALMARPSLAANIPTPNTPAGANQNDILSIFGGYTKLFMTFAVIAAGSLILIIVIMKILKSYQDWQDSKINASDFLGSALVGGFLIIISGFLLWYALTNWIANIPV